LFKRGTDDADLLIVQLEQCPYDRSPITVEPLEGGAQLVACDACGAAWELRGTWIHRVREPDVATVRALREELFPSTKA